MESRDKFIERRIDDAALKQRFPNYKQRRDQIIAMYERKAKAERDAPAEPSDDAPAEPSARQKKKRRKRSS